MSMLDAVICFMEGTVTRCSVLEIFGVSPGENMRNDLVVIDRRREAMSDNWVLHATKEAKTTKRNLQDEYGPGIH